MATAVDFGQDTSCTTSLRTGQLVSGPRLVAEALYRRFTTPRGMLRGGEDEANYGLDLVGIIGSVSTKSDAAALEGRILSEAQKDERIQSVSVTVNATTSGPSTSFAIAISATTAAGPFTLQLAVSAVTVELIGIKVGT